MLTIERTKNKFSDHEKGWQAAGYLHLHLDRHRLDAGEGEGLDAGHGHEGHDRNAPDFGRVTWHTRAESSRG